MGRRSTLGPADFSEGTLRTMTSHDPRLTPARPDLAAAHLRDTIKATRYVDGRRCQVCVPILDLKRQPRSDAGLDTQLLHGESLRVYEEVDGWAWVQAERDDYVGYVATHGLRDTIVEATHQVVVNRTFIYPAPNMKQPVTAALPVAARVAVRDIAGSFARLDGGGYVFTAHLAEARCPSRDDVVELAERLCGIPYLWGGRTPLGIDCSGLVQLSFAMADVAMPRDTDMQEKCGRELRIDEDLEGLARGDLVFWRGHVGIMSDPSTLLHANAHHMLVRKEPLREAVDRIARGTTGECVTSIRRRV